MLTKELRKLSSISFQPSKTKTLALSLETDARALIETSQKLFSGILKNSLLDPKVTFKHPKQVIRNLSLLPPNEFLHNIRSYISQTHNLSPNSSTQPSSIDLEQSFLEKCQNCGFSENSSKEMLYFIKILNFEVPITIDSKKFSELLKSLQQFFEEYKKIRLEYLRNELWALEKKIEPLRKEHSLIKKEVRVSAEWSYKLGAVAVISQIAGLCWGAQVFYGVDFALSGLVFGGIAGVTWSGIFYGKIGAERTIKGRIFDFKMKKMIFDGRIDVKSIEQLRNEIKLIRDEILELD